MIGRGEAAYGRPLTFPCMLTNLRTCTAGKLAWRNTAMWRSLYLPVLLFILDCSPRRARLGHWITVLIIRAPSLECT